MKVCNNCHQHYIESTCPHCAHVPKGHPTKMLGLILGVGLTACAVAESKYGVPMVDNDDDGFYADMDDCDDSDPNTFPGAAVEDSDTACMTDADGDGYGDANPANESVEPGTDCDDSDPDINPGNENCE